MAKKKKQIVCKKYGSTNITRDALVAWDYKKQTWVICGLLDCTNCENCEENCDISIIKERELKIDSKKYLTF